ncbi:MAG: CopG family ribbon-helix-helix protein [Acidobacteriaceae bacterium]
MSPRAGTSRTFTISFPPDLADQVERLAARESRTTSELFREAFRTYRAEQIRKAFEKLQSIADDRDTGEYGPEDVERLVDEDRAERWNAMKSAKL